MRFKDKSSPFHAPFTKTFYYDRIVLVFAVRRRQFAEAGLRMSMKLFDSEIKIMEVLWAYGECPAKDIARMLAEQVGWSKTTTYTVIKKCLDKGAVIRSEPGFLCRPAISRAEVREYETRELIDKMYGGMPDQLVASLLGRDHLSAEDITRLKKMIDESMKKTPQP